MNMSPPPVFGIIGAGFIGSIHLEALRAAGLRVAAIADPSPAALEKASALAPGARHYADWQELLADTEVTAVTICTINALHFEILAAAIASRRHVFCEKTMTINAAQARQALALRPAPGQVVQIGYMKRFFPASRWMKEHLPAIGKPLCATVRSFQGGFVEDGETIYDSPDWRPGPSGISRTRTFASAGMLNMAGSHMLDMTGWLLGTPQAVTCRTWAPAGYDAELHAHALFEMADDVMVHFEACLAPYHGTGFPATAGTNISRSTAPRDGSKSISRSGIARWIILSKCGSTGRGAGSGRSRFSRLSTCSSWRWRLLRNVARRERRRSLRCGKPRRWISGSTLVTNRRRTIRPFPYPPTSHEARSRRAVAIRAHSLSARPGVYRSRR
jgi:predicted dehydrogenase